MPSSLPQAPPVGWEPWPAGRGYALAFLGVLVAYVAAGRFGLSLSFVHVSASPVWAPTGIAIGACLVFGARIWPAILIAAVLVNVTTTVTLSSALCIATGNTLEGVVGALLVQRFGEGRRAFARPGGIFRFVVLAGLASTAISATVGVTSLVLLGDAVGSRYLPIWSTWWLGNVTGALLVTPVIVLWSERSAVRWSPWKLGEVGALLVILIVVSQLVFGGLWPIDTARYPIQFLCAPLLMWAAFRFGPRETATASLLLAAVAVRATFTGRGPFVTGDANESLLLLQSFMAVNGVMSLAVASSVRSQRKAEQHARSLAQELERQVVERTTQLFEVDRELGHEIAVRERTAEDLRRSEARLVEAQRVANVGSWEWEIAENHLTWSEELSRIHGLAPREREMTFEQALAMVHPEDRREVERRVRAAVGDRRSIAFEHRLVRPDGEERILFARVRVLVNAQGDPVAVIGTGQDVTERKQAEAERDQLLREQVARQEAEQSSRNKDQFLAMLGHELRNPLGIISNAVELFRLAGPAEPALNDLREMMQRQVWNMTRIIDDLLDVSRITRGRVHVSKGPCDLVALVRETAADHRDLFEQSGISLDVDLPGHPLWLMGDRTRLAQVLTNLLHNANKFTGTGGAVRISVEEGVGGEQGILTVSDTGAGMEPATLERAFDPFTQGDRTIERSQGGLGLGLALVKGLVELHGGTVRAASGGAGRGSQLEVRLPLDSVAASAQVRSGSTTVVQQSRRVLVVEDNEVAARTMRMFLTGQGHAVEVARSGPEGIRAARRFHPEVVLCDIGLPGADGYEVARVLRKEQQVAGLLLIAVTGYGQEADRLRAREAGFDLHLTKPVSLTELTELLARDG